MHMDKLKRIFSSNASFFTGALIFLVIGFCYVLITSRANGFLDLSFYHNGPLDNFFIYFTNLGDGIFTLIVVGILLLVRLFNFALQLLLAFLLSGLIAQLLKNFIFSPRPKDFFMLSDHIHIIEGITLGGKASFPSGHSATVFALATSLALYDRNKKRGWLYLVLAILVGYSRIYLSQHFPLDVWTGALIGLLVAVWVYLLLDKYVPVFARKKLWKKDK